MSKDVYGRFAIVPESCLHQFYIAEDARVSFPDVSRPNFPDIQFKHLKFHHLQMIQKVQREML